MSTEALKGVAFRLGRASGIVASVHDVWAGLHEFERKFFEPDQLKRLNNLSHKVHILSNEFEDLSETIALGASKTFINAVLERLESAKGYDKGD